LPMRIAFRSRRGEVDPDAWEQLTSELPAPPQDADRDDLLWREFAAQFRWYDRAATRTRTSYQLLKVTTLVAGATVTLLAAISAPAALTACIAAVIVIAEGAQQTFQFHANWISYRGSAELLRQQAFKYVTDVPPYDDPTKRRERLSHSLMMVTTKEKTTWSDTMKQAPGAASS
jgi:Protein of unknown function (DUF4231)